MQSVYNFEVFYWKKYLRKKTKEFHFLDSEAISEKIVLKFSLIKKKSENASAIKFRKLSLNLAHPQAENV